jgi:hypothetical protein
MNITVADSDIQTPTGADYDPNAAGTPDLTEVARLTDHRPRELLGVRLPASPTTAGTATELDFGPVPIECTPSGSPAVPPAATAT